MPDTPRLRLESVSKLYRLPEARSERRWLRAGGAAWLYEKRRDVWALRDINLDLGPGHAVGVIGQNGSGKSTLLKLVAGVSGPTEGVVDVRGSVVGLLELGAGFHPDLTGYQNVYLQGNLIGLRKAEIDRRLDAIVEYSGLGHFMEWPVKRYSDGMYARLGFSVALHAGANIVLIDEILAVGDAEFQRKGLAHLRRLREEGQTIILLVSHSLGVIEEFCDEAIWLEGGRIRERGSPRAVCDAYRHDMMRNALSALGYGADRELIERARTATTPGSPIRILDVSFRDAQGREIQSTPPRQHVEIVLSIEADRPILGADLSAFLARQDELIAAEMLSAETGRPIDLPAGRSEIVIRLAPLLLADGDYSCTALLAESPERERFLALIERAGHLAVLSDPPPATRIAMYQPAHWTFEPGASPENEQSD